MARRKRVRLDKKGRAVKSAPQEAPVAEAPSGDAEGASESCDCPVLDAEDWDAVESDWSDIQFVKVNAKALLGVPLGFEGLRDRLRAAADEAGATIPTDAMLLLGEGRFLRPVMLEVEGADTGAGGVILPGGVAYTRLMPAPWGDMAKRAATARNEARERFGRDPDDFWLWYLTCKTCSADREYETLFVAHYASDPVAAAS